MPGIQRLDGSLHFGGCLGVGEGLSADGEVDLDHSVGKLAHERSAGAEKGGVGYVVAEEGVEVADDLEGLGGRKGVASPLVAGLLHVLAAGGGEVEEVVVAPVTTLDGLSEHRQVCPAGEVGNRQSWSHVVWFHRLLVIDQIIKGRGAMDVIYHRNCLDGVYASFVPYLVSRLITMEHLQSVISILKGIQKKQSHSLAGHFEDIESKCAQLQVEQGKVELNEEFFHTPAGVTVNAFSYFAGEYYPLAFPGPKRLLLILDTNLAKAENVIDACKQHEMVVLVDHHTSFLEIKAELDAAHLDNLVYLFDEGDCAARLTYSLLFKLFPVKHRLPAGYLGKLQQELEYVSANDTKVHESRESKQFILGFYYFEIELSHMNPLLYKRIGLLDIEYVMQKGTNQYEMHLKQIAKEVSHARVAQIKRGAFKGHKCLYLEPTNARKISDIGNVMAYLSASHEMVNLAVLAMKKEYEVRVSCRSHKSCGDAKALTFSSAFGGGGHTQAAGFKIHPNELKSLLKTNPAGMFGVKVGLSCEQVEEILLSPGHL